MRTSVIRPVVLTCLLAAGAAPCAQAQTAAVPSTPPLLLIYREEVKPGHGAAHAANESAWASAFQKAQAPVQWLAMTSVFGPSEAWFLSGYESYAAQQKVEDAMDDTPALRTADDKYSSQESDHLSRTTAMMAGFRPGMSYQSNVNLPAMRYMQVDVVRVKPGHETEFRRMWQMLVATHTAAKMDEHWAVYEVEAGAPSGTFLFFYPMTNLATVDASGPMHGASFREALGDENRERSRQVTATALDSRTTLVFKLRPAMSTLPPTWSAADPFWAPKAGEAAPAVAAAAKKRN